MRTSVALLALSAAVAVNAAVLQPRQYPECVGQCIGTASASIGCSVSDAQCLCTSETFINNVAQCFASSCNAADASAGVTLGQQLCSTVGLPITIPTFASAVLAQGSSGANGGGGGASSTPASSGASASSSSSSSPSSAPASAPSTTAAPASSNSAPSSSAAAAAAAPSASPTGAGFMIKADKALAGVAALGGLLALML